MKRSGRYNQYAVLSVMAVGFVGCGSFPSSVHSLPAGSYSQSGANTAVTGDTTPQPDAAGYLCPNSPNITPSYEYQLDGSGYFTVCNNQADQSKILIHGQTQAASNGSAVVCVFPAQYISRTQIFAKPDLATGGMVQQCNEVGSSGLYAKFDYTNYNSVFIVDGQDKAAMDACLKAGNASLCPTYSFGRFR